MNDHTKKFIIFFTCLLLSCACFTQVYADEGESEQERGSIKLILEDPEDKTPIQGARITLYSCLLQEKLAVVSQESSVDGTVLFAGLEEGDYLLVQDGFAGGCYPMQEFVVSIPLLDAAEDSYCRDIVARPKMERLTPVSESGPPSEATSIPALPASGERLNRLSSLAGTGVILAGLGCFVLLYLIRKQEVSK
ncbi:MAG: hypothetical protein PHR37_03790 [Eubacteriales bacterium]|nr:hypothetical protein [Eubacteriales bacterium]